jgi:hypothetical protein
VTLSAFGVAFNGDAHRVGVQFDDAAKLWSGAIDLTDAIDQVVDLLGAGQVSAKRVLLRHAPTLARQDG